MKTYRLHEGELQELTPEQFNIINGAHKAIAQHTGARAVVIVTKHKGEDVSIAINTSEVRYVI